MVHWKHCERLARRPLSWIATVTGPPVRAAPPDVRFVTHDLIREVMGDGQKGAIGAMAHRGRDVVSLGQRLD